MVVCANCARELQPTWKYCISCGTRVPVVARAVPSAIRPEPAGSPATAPINVLAVLGLILGCLLSPLAAVFGHLALAQIRVSGERGRIAALIAIVLGYLWLVALVVVAVVFLRPRG